MSPDCNWLPLPVQVKCHDDVQSGVACIAQLNLPASSFISCISCEMALNLVSEKITQFKIDLKYRDTQLAMESVWEGETV